jgi:signal transduction histidine kinase
MLARFRDGSVFSSLAASWIAPPLALALALVFVVVNEVGHRTVREVTAERDRVIESRIAIGRLRGAVVAAESSQRALLLTERPVYREEFSAALDSVLAAVKDVREIVGRRPGEAEALTKILDVGENKIAEMQETVKRIDAGQREAAVELVMSGIGREQMAEINRRVNLLTADQMVQLQDLGEQRDRVLLYSRFSILSLVLACLAAVLTAMRLLRNRESDRLAHLAALRAERDSLEGKVAEQTRSLTELAQHLQSVREDERSHLARELHDELGGLLTAAKLDLARMRTRLAQAGPEVAERVEHLKATLDAGIALKRRIIEDLRPSSLDNLGLVPALQILCSDWSARSEVPVALELEPLTLSPERALATYRLVQEALTNVAKYAQASQVWVVLRADPLDAGQALLSVRDDGQGFDASQRTAGHGLAGMRFRVATCGGELQVDSAAGAGTTIRARLPLA